MKLLSNSIHRSQQGWSLVELLVAMTLSLLAIAGAGQIYLSVKRSYDIQASLARLQDVGRYATPTRLYSPFRQPQLRYTFARLCLRQRSAWALLHPRMRRLPPITPWWRMLITLAALRPSKSAAAPTTTHSPNWHAFH